MSLYNAKINTPFQIVSIPDVELLKNLGVNISREVTIQNRYAFGGPVLLRVQGTYSVALGKDIASQILVKEVAIR